MEYYLALKNNEFMKFLGKWVELENIILSEVTQSQKDTHGMHSLISGYSPETWKTQDTIHISNDVQEEGRRDPWSWKCSMQQCRGIPGQGSRRGLIGKSSREEGLCDFQGWGNQARGNEMFSASEMNGNRQPCEVGS